MKRLCLFTELVALLFLGSMGWAAVPQLINFQGILKNGSGQPAPDGTYSVTFKIYDTPSGGNVLWTEARSITTSGGLFTVLLGAATPVPDSVFRDSSRYLGITVSPDAEMTPRQRLASLGYGYRVSSVDEALGGTIEGDVIIHGRANIGPGNSNPGPNAFVAGAGNAAGGNVSFVAGGTANSANGQAAFIGAGVANSAGGSECVVGGGLYNEAVGLASTVPGGQYDTAFGTGCFAAGQGAKAGTNGTFVWSDGSSSSVFASTGINQFLIRASGGVGIQTNTPHAGLDVQASMRINDSTLWLRGSTDQFHGLGWYGAGKLFASTNVDGPVAFGYSGGALGTNFNNVQSVALYWNHSGDVGIGTTNPTNPLQMGSGAFCSAVGVWTNASSRAYKTDIRPLEDQEYADILDKLKNLDVVRFKYKKDPTRDHIGLIAEDVPKEIASDDRTGVPTADAIAFLMAALKAQQAKIETLEQTVRRLKEKGSRR